MNIYKISQDVNYGEDTYDSAVVIAKNEEQAKRIYPSSNHREAAYYDEEEKAFYRKPPYSNEYTREDDKCSDWTNDLNKIKVEYLGELKVELESKVIITSSNNGH